MRKYTNRSGGHTNDCVVLWKMDFDQGFEGLGEAAEI